jgi:hypothetical protein
VLETEWQESIAIQEIQEPVSGAFAVISSGSTSISSIRQDGRLPHRLAEGGQWLSAFE